MSKGKQTPPPTYSQLYGWHKDRIEIKRGSSLTLKGMRKMWKFRRSIR